MLETIQRVSAVFRYLLIAVSAVVLGALILALLTPGLDWISVGDGTFAELWHSGASSHLTLLLVKLATATSTANSSVSFEVGRFVELVVLLLIVHLLKEAQQLCDENKAFV